MQWNNLLWLELGCDPLGWKTVRRWGMKCGGEIAQVISSAVRPPSPSTQGSPGVMKVKDIMVGWFPVPWLCRD